MTEFLKKLGVPALIAGIIGALATIVPILFKVDERYAKEQQLTAEVVRLEGQINDLSIEVGKLAGSTQVLVSVISAKQEAPRVAYRAVVPNFDTLPPTNASERAPASVPEVAASAPAPVIEVKPVAKIVPSQQLQDVAKSLESTQQRIQQLRESQLLKK